MKQFNPTIHISLILAIMIMISGCNGDNGYVTEFDQPTYYHILGTGQSMSLGGGSTPPLSGTQPFQNLMLSGYQQMGPDLIPLIERPENNFYLFDCESPSSGLANNFTFLTSTVGPPSSFIVTMHGIGGAMYPELKKGSERFEMGRQQVIKSKLAVENMGLKYKVLAVTTIHGESDGMLGTGFRYYDYLHQWQADYNEMAKSITGQVEDVPLFLCQLSSFAAIKNYSPRGVNALEIALAQLQASTDNPDIFLVGPKYHLPFNGAYHLTNISSRWLGEKYAEVMWRVFRYQEDWLPLMPDPASPVYMEGNKVYIRLHVPDPPVVIDTQLVPPAPGYGFSFVDSHGEIPVKNVYINGNVVMVELSCPSFGENKKIRYACGSDMDDRPAIGNIRDSDACHYYYNDLPAYNWLVHFERDVVVNQ